MDYEAGSYDIAVIGAGHAGIEAALAAARLGLNTLCFTVNLDAVGNMPCNPAIGGTGKGHLVPGAGRPGGRDGQGRRRGPASSTGCSTGARARRCWSLRAQADRRRYQEIMKHTLERQEHLWVKQAEVTDIYAEGGRVTAVRTAYRGGVPGAGRGGGLGHLPGGPHHRGGCDPLLRPRRPGRRPPPDRAA